MFYTNLIKCYTNIIKIIMERLRRGVASLGREESRNQYLMYLHFLGLRPEKLKLKERILDLGGADGVFALYVGGNVITLDIAAHEYYQVGSRDVFSKAVSAKAEELPFPNSSFDLIVSFLSVPYFYSVDVNKIPRDEGQEEKSIYSLSWIDKRIKSNFDVEDVTRKFIDEQIRVLRVGGELRCAPIIKYNDEGTLDNYFIILDKVLNDCATNGKIEYKFEWVRRSPDEVENRKSSTIYRLVVIKK